MLSRRRVPTVVAHIVGRGTVEGTVVLCIRLL